MDRTTCIVSFPADEIPKTKQKFLNADYSHRFINSVITNFQEKLEETDDIIFPGFFDVPRLHWIHHTVCAKNEEFLKRFMKKFDVFTDKKYDICIKWFTKKLKQLFKLKSRNPHPACAIYKGVCSCQESCIGDTAKNVETRWQEHEDTQKDSEHAKHLKNIPSHSFSWKVLFPASANRCTRHNTEASIIALQRPSLKNELRLRNYRYFEKVSLRIYLFICNYVNNFLNYFMKFCVYQYSTEDAYCEKLFLIYF